MCLIGTSLSKFGEELFPFDFISRRGQAELVSQSRGEARHTVTVAKPTFGPFANMPALTFK